MIVIGAVGIGVACGIRKGVRGDRDHSVGGAVGVGSEGGVVNGAGVSGLIGEGATGNGDVGFNEIG